MTAYSITRLIPDPPGKIVAGEVIYKGKDLLKLSYDEMKAYRGKEIAMIFQGPMTSLNPVFTCGEQVEEAIKIHERDIQKKDLRLQTMELFRKVALQDPMQIYISYPHQLSGGQKQRVWIAMAISGHPRLLIADEPTTALDVTVQSAILKLIRNIREEFGSRILFISHDLGVIPEIADRVVVMYKGQIVEEGKTEDVFSRPRRE